MVKGLIKGKVYASHRYENLCIHFQTQMHNITHKHIYFTKAECLQPLASVTRVGKCYCQSCISLQVLCHACTLQLTAAVLFLPGQQDMGWHGEKEQVYFSLPGVVSRVPLILQKVREKCIQYFRKSLCTSTNVLFFLSSTHVSTLSTKHQHAVTLTLLQLSCNTIISLCRVNQMLIGSTVGPFLTNVSQQQPPHI